MCIRRRGWDVDLGISSQTHINSFQVYYKATQFELHLRTNLEYSIRLHQYLTIITTTFFKMLSNLLRDITMSSTSNSHLNYAPSSSSTKSAKTTSTSVSECSDTVSLSSQKTLVGKVFSRKSSESTRSMTEGEAAAKEAQAAARAHYFATL